MKAMDQFDDPEWSDAALADIEAQKVKYIDSIRELGHGKRLASRVKAGDELATNVIGPHSISSFTTEWRAFPRSEEHTSELQSLMRISYAVFCLKKKS